MSAVADPKQRTYTRAELAARWAELAADPVLRDLPFRMELNKWGHIEMTPPASPGHMRIATRLALLLREALGGDAFTECAIATASGVKIADVVWCSDGFLARHRDALSTMQASLTEAPDLCIEVMSPSNLLAELSEKAALYLEAGARESWIVLQDFGIQIFVAQGQRQHSAFAVDAARLQAELRTL
jgi:Uma2 family endonuclease